MHLEKHHIVYKSQLGLDFELNYKYLTPVEHRGNNGPHLDWKVDLLYKMEMQLKLENLLTEDYYTIEELIRLLGLKEKQAYKAFRHTRKYSEGMKTRDIIFRLMGNAFYEIGD